MRWPFGSHARSFRVDEQRNRHFRLSRLSRGVRRFGAPHETTSLPFGFEIVSRGGLLSMVRAPNPVFTFWVLTVLLYTPPSGDRARSSYGQSVGDRLSLLAFAPYCARLSFAITFWVVALLPGVLSHLGDRG